MNAAFITPLAIVLSGIIAICISKYHSNWANKASRVKATFDALNEKQWDKDYILALSIFANAIGSGPNGITNSIKEEASNPPDQDRMSVETAARLIMNDYELTFIAIEEGVLDERLVRLWKGSSMIRHFNSTKTYVEWMRAENKNDNIFKVFQKKVEVWEANQKEWEKAENGNGK